MLPSSPDDHYRAVCRALTTESIELRVFLSKVFTNDAEALRIKADAQSSRQELAKLDFTDWVSTRKLISKLLLLQHKNPLVAAVAYNKTMIITQ